MNRFHVGDCRVVLATLDPASVDAIVTDPPYGLGFMGKDWDHEVPGPEFWAAALRVAKPGAHLVACGGTRTSHRLVCAIEDAGWEIRDSLSWLYGSGFPKSLNVSKAIDKAAGAEREVIGPRTDGRYAYAQQDITGGRLIGGDNSGYRQMVTRAATAEAREWEGFGTALKPAHEPIVLARKPLIGTVTQNVLEHGTGALNIDACRIVAAEALIRPSVARTDNAVFGRGLGAGVQSEPGGRWPANVVLGCACEADHEPECAVALLDAQSGDRTGSHGRGETVYEHRNNVYGAFAGNRRAPTVADPYGGASRFFYTAKATRAEREAGVEHRAVDGKRGNQHPTVKPLALMRWLVRLVSKPGALVLDPFCGSGTTGVACALEGRGFIGIDMEAAHIETARARYLAAAEEAGTATPAEAAAVHDREAPVQLGLLGGER